MKTKFLILLLAGVALFCACSGKFKSETADSVSSTEKAKQKNINIGDTVQKPKLVKTADINFEVKNVQQTAEDISALTNKYNGMVVHHVMESTTGRTDEIRVSSDSTLKVTTYSITTDMVIKMPPANMEAFVDQVSRLGVQINNLKININDKSLDYLAAELKLKNRSQMLKQQKHESDGDLLNDKDNLVNRRIENLKTIDSAKRSTISLSFYANDVVKKQLVANNADAYNPPFFKRAGLSLAYGWGILVDIFIELTKVWILIPIGIAGWFAFKKFRNKKTDELIKTQ